MVLPIIHGFVSCNYCAEHNTLAVSEIATSPGSLVTLQLFSMHSTEEAADGSGARKVSSSMYSISTADRNRAALYSDASDQFRVPLSVLLNVVRCKFRLCQQRWGRFACSSSTAVSVFDILQETFESVLDLASRLHLNCLTQKCEEMLASSEFELTPGSSETDCHSVVRWAHVAQKHHLVVRRKDSFCGFWSSHTTEETNLSLCI